MKIKFAQIIIAIFKYKELKKICIKIDRGKFNGCRMVRSSLEIAIVLFSDSGYIILLIINYSYLFIHMPFFVTEH